MKELVRLAALGDLHYGKHSQGLLATLFAGFGELNADVLVLCGDLTDYGLPDEARALVRELTPLVKIPIVSVLGNHDFESDAAPEVTAILREAGLIVLDGDTCEIEGIGFAGIKGFAGGFGRGVLGPWGERTIKHFVREALDETLKLESALARLRTPQRVAVLHYAPIQATVEGEPREIFPFLGCSRLEEPLARYDVSTVVHGHAHNGAAEGRTATGIPVYNVSLPLLRREQPDRPFRILEIKVQAEQQALALHQQLT
jgi:Icc-related predicted phosphoesterase